MPRLEDPSAIVIPKRFNGPPASGNGGYSAGLFAALLRSDPAEGDAAPSGSPRAAPAGRTSARGLSAEGELLAVAQGLMIEPREA